MQFIQNPPRVQAMRFIHNDPTSGVTAVNAWLEAVQLEIDPAERAWVRKDSPGSWSLVTYDTASPGIDLPVPLGSGDWVVVALPADPTGARVVSDVEFARTHSPAK